MAYGIGSTFLTMELVFRKSVLQSQHRGQRITLRPPTHKNMKKITIKTPSVWATSEGKFITDPTSIGFGEKDCGPNFLCHPNGEYCERIEAFRVCFAAVDGSYRKPAKTVVKVVEIIKERGCWNRAGGVTDDGIVRLDGIQYRHAGSKTWFNISLPEVVSLLSLP